MNYDCAMVIYRSGGMVTIIFVMAHKTHYTYNLLPCSGMALHKMALLIGLAEGMQTLVKLTVRLVRPNDIRHFVVTVTDCTGGVVLHTNASSSHIPLHNNKPDQH